MKLCSNITHSNLSQKGDRISIINFQKTKRKKELIVKKSCSLPHTEGDAQTVVLVEKSAGVQEDTQDGSMTTHKPTCPTASASLLLGVTDQPVWEGM